jgi:hypothetical protein
MPSNFVMKNKIVAPSLFIFICAVFNNSASGQTVSQLRSILAHELTISRCIVSRYPEIKTQDKPTETTGKITHTLERARDNQWLSDTKIELVTKIRGKPSVHARRLVINEDGVWEITGSTIIKLPADLNVERPQLAPQYIKHILDEIGHSDISYMRELNVYRVTPSPALVGKLYISESKWFPPSPYTIDLAVDSTGQYLLGASVNQPNKPAKVVRNFAAVDEIMEKPDHFLVLPANLPRIFPSSVKQYHKVLMMLMRDKTKEKQSI